MYSHWPWAHATLCTCPCQCLYLMLSVGNVHVTVKNYECGVRGAFFLRVLTAEACFFKLSEPAAVALHPAACRKLPLKQSCRGQEVTAQHQNGMFLPGSRSSLQSQRGPEIIWDHRHMLHLVCSPPRYTFIWPCAVYWWTLVLLGPTGSATLISQSNAATLLHHDWINSTIKENQKKC